MLRVALQVAYCLGAFAVALYLPACGGGSSGSAGPNPPTSAPIAPLPASETQSVALSPTPQTLVFTTLSSGVAGTIGFPATTSATANVTEESTLPSGVPTPARALSAEATKRILTLGGAVTALLYVTITPNVNVTFGTAPSFSVNFPPGTLAGNVYLVDFNSLNPSAGWNVVAGPLPGTGTSIAFPQTALAPPQMFGAGAAFTFAIVEISTPLPTPPPTPTITEYPITTANSQPGGVAEGPDGAMWFTEFSGGGGQIGRITTAGAITEYLAWSAPLSITTGPDGAMWFTEYAAGQIGRISTAGTVTQYPIPSNSAQVIAAGPDGALWFTEGGKIGRITTSGAFSEYSLPAGRPPNSIAAGPDGSMWFTECGDYVLFGCSGNNIGRITMAGVINEYPIPTGASGSSGIVAGPDSAMWFAESNGNKIGRITMAGVVNEYPIPTVGSQPLDITAGPDGAMWFTEGSADQIGRISTAGVITEYPIPTGASFPSGIALGPDGALWFTENSANKIGRIHP